MTEEFEFNDESWAEVNRHAGLPHDARVALENAVSLYRRVCSQDETRLRNSEVKEELKQLAKKAAALFEALDALPADTRMALIRFAARAVTGKREVWAPSLHDHDTLINKHKAEILALRDWATNAALTLGKQKPGADPGNRDWLIRAAAKIYDGYSKTPFKDFPYKKKFIFDLLPIAGADTERPRAIELVINACCAGEADSRRLTSNN